MQLTCEHMQDRRRIKFTEEKRNPGSSTKVKKMKQEAVMVRNDDAEEAWKLRPGEKWNQIFRYKSRDRPHLSTYCKLCLKYHIKGFCFTYWNFRGSHMKLVGDDFLRTEEYIKSFGAEGPGKGLASPCQKIEFCLISNVPIWREPSEFMDFPIKTTMLRHCYHQKEN